MNGREHTVDPIVLVGARRSGTTLLRTILAQNRALCVFPAEPQFFLGLYDSQGNGPLDCDKAVAYVGDHAHRAPEISAAQLATALAAIEPIDMGAFVQTYLALWARVTGCSGRVVIKHPRLVFYLDQVLGWLANVRVVNIVRDPRANVASQRARWPTQTFWECVALWQDSIRDAEDFGLRHTTQFFNVRYESLVMEPEKTVTKLCDALCITFEPKMLEFSLATRSFSPGAEAETVLYSRPDTSRLLRYRDQLKAEEVAIIEKQCRSEMSRYGYEPDAPAVSRVKMAALLAKRRPEHGVRTVGRSLKRWGARLGLRGSAQ